MLYLYDPRTNISSKTSYKELEGISGMPINSLQSAKSRGRKIRILNCYITKGVAPLKLRREWYALEKYPDEAWVPVEGFNNQFLISNYGRIRKIFKTSERLMLPYQRKGEGNLFVKMNGQDMKVGQLVADHFIRKRRPDERVVRKNGIITDDYAGNLEIVSTAELGKRTGYKAKSMAVVQIDTNTLEVVNEYRSAREAGRNYYLSYQAILDRCNGIYKQSDGFIWMFAEDYEKQKVSKIS